VPDVVLDLARSLQEPARARAFVAEQLAAYPESTRLDAVLLVSELVSNVVQHGALPARISLRVDNARLHVTVEDSSSAMPEGPGLPDVQAPNGRGLIIVAAIASAWGITTAVGHAGKGVWFDLAIAP
jgi:two-component sensor histidine kinase